MKSAFVFICGVLGLFGGVLFEARAVQGGPAMVFDAGNSKIVYAEDPDRLWHPASLTKMMTAYLTFEAIKAGVITLKSELIVSAEAHRQPPSKIGLPIGGKMSVELGLKTLIVKSSNDVAVMLAEGISGTEPDFVARMNDTAKRLGMTKSRFYNPNGLPDARQVVTARDMALLAQALLKEYPEHAHYFAMPNVRIGKRRLRSHNDLLRTFDGANGMKTGFICASGYNVVASAVRDGRQLIAVVLGAKSSGLRRQRASDLLEHGFQNYQWKDLLFESSFLTDPVNQDEIRGPKNMRRLLRPYICGNRPPVQKSAKKRTAKKKKKPKKK